MQEVLSYRQPHMLGQHHKADEAGGDPLRQGTTLTTRTSSGGLSGSPPGFSATLISLFCTTTRMAWVIAPETRAAAAPRPAN